MHDYLEAGRYLESGRSAHEDLYAAYFPVNYSGGIRNDLNALPKILEVDPLRQSYCMKDVIALLDVLAAYSTAVEGAAVDRDLWEEAVGPLRKAYPDCVIVDNSISINPYFDGGFIGLVVYAEFYDPHHDLVRARVVATSVYEENPEPELVKHFYRQRWFQFDDEIGQSSCIREEGRFHESLLPTLQAQVEGHLGPSVLADVLGQDRDDPVDGRDPAGAVDVAGLLRTDAADG